MFMKKVFLLIGSILLLASCTLAPFSTEDDTEENNENNFSAEEDSSLFTETESSETQNSTFTFETNDSSYITKKGFTIWGVNQTNTSDDFEEIKVTLYKSSGNSDAGYGIVFLKQEVDEKDFLVTVMINTKAQYIIGKVTDGNFTSISEWKTSSRLYSGYGIKNTVSVSYDEENADFVLCFNDQKESIFKIDEEINFKNSQSGFVAVISGSEKFPSIPVKIVYENNGDE